MKIYDMQLDPLLHQCALHLDASPDYRVLRRLPRVEELWMMSSPNGPDITLGIVDTETSGLGPDAKIVEIAVRRMELVDGQLADLSPSVSMLEDPGEPLSPAITRITGLTDEDLAGQRFNEELLAHSLGKCDALVAFNARFDAGHLRRRFPGIRHPWICAQRDYPWSANGHQGRGQQALVEEMGWFYPPHRAAADIEALAIMIAMHAKDGRSIAAHLVERAQRTDARIAARDAPFAVKDLLKARNYRWNADRRVWTIDCDAADVDAEIAALARISPMIRPGMTEIDWYNRHVS